GAVGFARHIPRLVNDRNGAIAVVFVDLAIDDVNQSRPIVVAVPRHDAAGLDHKFADALHASFRLDRFLAEVVRRENRVADAGSLEITRLADVGLDFVGRTFARVRSGHKNCQTENETSECYGTAKTASWRAEHVGGSY